MPRIAITRITGSIETRPSDAGSASTETGTLKESDITGRCLRRKRSVHHFREPRCHRVENHTGDGSWSNCFQGIRPLYKIRPRNIVLCSRPEWNHALEKYYNFCWSPRIRIGDRRPWCVRWRIYTWWSEATFGTITGIRVSCISLCCLLNVTCKCRTSYLRLYQ